MCGATSSKQTSVALQIKVEFGGVGYFTIDNSPGTAVEAPIGFGFVVLILREETDVVTLHQ